MPHSYSMEKNIFFSYKNLWCNSRT